MDNTKIEWADASWTPIRARNLMTGKVGWHCEHVSEGCRFCYAETLNRRLGTTFDFKPGHRADIDIVLDEKMLTQPLRWKRSRRIFVCSMTDLFADFVSDEMIDRVFAVMALAPQHKFLVLSKRAARMQDYFAARTDGDPWAEAAGYIADLVGMREHPVVLEPSDMPLANLWLGVSVEDQARADERISLLLATPAAVRFLSCEPLLGAVDLRLPPAASGPAVDWVIAGGESGRGARPMHPDWARSLRDQCQAAGVPFFFKQWGEHAPPEHIDPGWPALGYANDALEFGGTRVGKKRAGRLLDGREWSEFPS